MSGHITSQEREQDTQPHGREILERCGQLLEESIMSTEIETWFAHAHQFLSSSATKSDKTEQFPDYNNLIEM
jgi:hypothetical protein